MLVPRIIPVLLLENNRLVKTIKFQSPKYIGDPLNTVRIFNEKLVDELIVLNIDKESKDLNYDLISRLATECRMPLCYGGGIDSLDKIKKIISLGVEKISICSNALANPNFIKEAIKLTGSQSIVVTLDLLLHDGEYKITTKSGSIKHDIKLFDYLEKLEQINVGEILINFIDRDGTMQGYDLETIKLIARSVTMPCTFLGGASSYKDISNLFKTCGNVGAAAGSLFVFNGPYKAVLISYPSRLDKTKILNYGYN
jgi:cyclase